MVNGLALTTYLVEFLGLLCVFSHKYFISYEE